MTLLQEFSSLKLLDLTLLFFLLSIFVSAIMMMLSKHPMRMALLLINIMLSLGMIYGLMGNYVMAVSQVLIYVGAIMIFMIYVIMLLDIKDTSLSHPYTKYLKWSLLSGFIFIPLFSFFYFTKRELFFNSTLLPKGEPFLTVQFTTFKDFANSFIHNYWIIFELSSILLMVATVAAVTIIKKKEKVEE